MKATDEYFVYPGQPLVIAGDIVEVFDSLTEAAELTEHGFCKAEGHRDVSGAGSHPTAAISAMKGFREHGSIDQVISDLHTAWRVRVGCGNFDDRFEEGQRKAKEFEPILRERLETWLKEETKS